MPFSKRSAGVLLHPTSLPSPFGIGDLGPEAYGFVDWLTAAGQTWWQMLPLGPTGSVRRGNSPYSAWSVLARHELLISPELLVQDGLLQRSTITSAPGFSAGRVDFSAVETWKGEVLSEAVETFRRGTDLQRDFRAFCEGHPFLDESGLYRALELSHDGAPWPEWEDGLRKRETDAMEAARREFASEIQAHRIRQFLFHRQWQALRAHCRKRRIQILGDVPIYCELGSAEVWAHQHLFQLGNNHLPTEVSGVPGDYFAEEGQLWGHPLYRWDVMAADGFALWMDRIARELEGVDALRIDHFRALEAYWAVPFGQQTAMPGRWVLGPGDRFCRELSSRFGDVFLAEDLGVIDDGVRNLRDRWGFPGMAVFQFGFDGDLDNLHLPHKHRRRQVVYTGTHDNDTTGSWLSTLQSPTIDQVSRYLGTSGRPTVWNVLRAVHGSCADTAMAPLQDVLQLGSDARMNQPGQPDGHWGWLLQPGQLTAELAERLRELTAECGRLAA